MNCNECRALIDAYLDGELTRNSKQQFLDHISSCDECKSELTFAESVKKTLSSMPKIEVPTDFTEKLNQKLMLEKKHKPVIHNIARYGSLAACLILAVVLGSNLIGNDFSPKFGFSEQDLSDISGQNYAGVATPTNDEINYQTKESNTPRLITPRGAQPQTTQTPDKTRSADVPANGAEAVSELVTAYDLEEDITAPVIKIAVSADDEAFVKELAIIYASLDNNTYTLDIQGFEDFISKLTENGITFSQSEKADDADKVNFVIETK